MLNTRGIHFEESDLAAQCGTHTGGTDYIGMITDVLNRHVHDADYITVDLPHDPPTNQEVETFWNNIRTSIEAGFGLVLNFVAPANNPPFPIKGSGPCPSFYGYGGTTFHYTALMGFSDEGGERAVWICDSGGAPFGYWITLRQCAILCAGKGYSWARPLNAPGIPTLPGPAPVIEAPTGKFWPVTADRIITSPFGPRWGTIHTGVDFGFNGGAGGRPVFAVQSGTVIFSGPASGYGGPDPCGWLVIDSDDHQGGGVFEYGHIVREPHLTVGAKVTAGQQIGIINPDEGTNGGVAPHLHLSYMPRGYDPGAKQDPLPVLDNAFDPGAAAPPPPEPAPSLAPGTPLTGRPWHHSVEGSERDLLLDMRAEGLLTQRLVWLLAERAGIDVAAAYRECRDSF